MIFVTVGNSHYGFPRLVEKMDALAPSLPMPVFIQLGWSTGKPVHAEWSAFLTYDQMMDRMSRAKLVVGHASAGPILHSRRLGIPLIAVPRRPELREHLDAHQVETGESVAGMAGIEVVWDVENLGSRIAAILADPGILDIGKTRPGDLASLVSGMRAWLDGVAAAKRRK